jgi:hypothetical protein
MAAEETRELVPREAALDWEVLPPAEAGTPFDRVERAVVEMFASDLSPELAAWLARQPTAGPVLPTTRRTAPSATPPRRRDRARPPAP